MNYHRRLFVALALAADAWFACHQDDTEGCHGHRPGQRCSCADQCLYLANQKQRAHKSASHPGDSRQGMIDNLRKDTEIGQAAKIKVPLLIHMVDCYVPLDRWYCF